MDDRSTIFLVVWLLLLLAWLLQNFHTKLVCLVLAVKIVVLGES